MSLHTCGGTVSGRHNSLHLQHVRLWTTLCTITRVDWLRHAPVRGNFSSSPCLREADLPAQRAPAQASPRLPCAHVDPRGPGDPEAASREGPEASVGLTARRRGGELLRVDRSVQTDAWAKPIRPDNGAASVALVHKRNRLSRSRDFDAVYRQ